jgi:hypothetical protein
VKISAASCHTTWINISWNYEPLKQPLSALNIIEKYRKYSDRQLIRVLLQESEYQHQAIQVAKSEINSRNLDLTIRREIEDSVREELELEKLKEKEKVASQDRKIEKVVTFIKSLNPIQENISTGERLFLFVGYTYLILNIASNYYDLISIYYAFQGADILKMTTVLTIGPFLLFLFTIYFYFKRSKVGWILMTGALSYDLFNAISYLLHAIDNPYNSIFRTSNNEPISLFWLTIPIIIYLALILVLFYKPVWKIFKVSTVQRVLTLCIGFIFLPIFWMIFYFLLDLL